jgi:multicomponent Na+:H+ antiporter subunit G
METRYLIGNILIGLGLAFILFGILCFFRFRNFYARVLVASIVDTMGFLTVLIGTALRSQGIFPLLKILLLGFTILFINPITTHKIARSAYLSGYRVNQEGDRDD